MNTILEAGTATAANHTAEVTFSSPIKVADHAPGGVRVFLSSFSMMTSPAGVHMTGNLVAGNTDLSGFSVWTDDPNGSFFWMVVAQSKPPAVPPRPPSAGAR
jgi:cytosine/uracil/thiamine/allantoin permease